MWTPQGVTNHRLRITALNSPSLEDLKICQHWTPGMWPWILCYTSVKASTAFQPTAFSKKGGGVGWDLSSVTICMGTLNAHWSRWRLRLLPRGKGSCLLGCARGRCRCGPRLRPLRVSSGVPRFLPFKFSLFLSLKPGLLISPRPHATLYLPLFLIFFFFCFSRQGFSV